MQEEGQPDSPPDDDELACLMRRGKSCGRKSVRRRYDFIMLLSLDRKEECVRCEEANHPQNSLINQITALAIVIWMSAGPTYQRRSV